MTINSRNIKLHKAEIFTMELKGFLNSIRCILDCPSRIFSACFYENIHIDQLIENQIEYINKEGQLLESTTVDYEGVKKLFLKLIYQKISENKTRATDNLDWNLVEMYGLLSSTDNESGPWNRLIDQDHKLLNYVNKEGEKALIFYVEFSDFIVATQLGISWK